MKKICLFVLIIFLGRFGLAGTKTFNAFDDAAMNIMTVYYSGMPPEQLAKEIAPTKKDIPELTKMLKKIGPVNFERTEDGLVISAKNEKVKVDLRRMHDNIVTIDGQQFTRDPSRPLWPQLEKFMKEKAKDKKTVFYHLFIQPAEAQWQLIPLGWGLVRGGLTFIGLSTAYKLVDYYGNTTLDVINYGACSFAENHMTSYYNSPPVCKSYKDLKADALKKMRDAAPAVGQSNYDILFTNRTCPDANRSYESQMALKPKDKLGKETEPMMYAIIGVGKDGAVDGAKVRRFTAATDDVVFQVDPKTFQVIKMTFPNPNPSASLKTIEMSLPVTEGEDALINNMAKMNQEIGLKISKELLTCTRKTEQAKAREAMETTTVGNKDGQK